MISNNYKGFYRFDNSFSSATHLPLKMPFLSQAALFFTVVLVGKQRTLATAKGPERSVEIRVAPWCPCLYHQLASFSKVYSNKCVA